MKYLYNLQWYRKARRDRFYKSSNQLTAGLFVIIRFNWLRGRIVMRLVTGGPVVYRLGNAGDFQVMQPEEVFPGMEPGQLQMNY